MSDKKKFVAFPQPQQFTPFDHKAWRAFREATGVTIPGLDHPFAVFTEYLSMMEYLEKSYKEKASHERTLGSEALAKVYDDYARMLRTSRENTTKWRTYKDIVKETLAETEPFEDEAVFKKPENPEDYDGNTALIYYKQMDAKLIEAFKEKYGEQLEHHATHDKKRKFDILMRTILAEPVKGGFGIPPVMIHPTDIPNYLNVEPQSGE